MKSQEFRDEHNSLLEKYDVAWSWNCDYSPCATGRIYSGRNPGDTGDEWNKFLFNITGIRIDEHGELYGDLEGAIKILKEGLEDIYESKTENLERIPINIWDEYYEEGYIPDGEIQETYIYVEDTDIPQEKRHECLKVLLDYMNKNLNLDGVKMWLELYESRKKYPNLIGNPDAEGMFFDRWEIKIEHLTHERRHKLVDELNAANITIDNVPFEIYSES